MLVAYGHQDTARLVSTNSNQQPPEFIAVKSRTHALKQECNIQFCMLPLKSASNNHKQSTPGNKKAGCAV